MATKPKRETKYDPPKFELKGFIRCDLDKDSIERLKKTVLDVEKMMENVEPLVDQQYKFGFSRDSYNNCYQATLTCMNKENQNFGWVLTGRGPTLGQALLVLMYKHFEVTHEAWPVDDDFGKTRDVWG